MSNPTLDRHDWFRAVMQVDGLSHSAKLVAGALAIQFVKKDTIETFVRQETLSDYLKIHRDTVKRVLRELRNAGWLRQTGDGGRGKMPMIRLLTPGKILPFRSAKGGANYPQDAVERGGEIREKGGQINPPHNKDEKALEKERARPPTTGRQPTIAPTLFGRTKFTESKWEGLTLVLLTDSDALNQWADFLRDEGSPKLCQLPIFAKNGSTAGFHLLHRFPPKTEKGKAEFRWYVRTLMDAQAASHAAQ